MTFSWGEPFCKECRKTDPYLALVLQVPWKMYSSKAVAAQSFMMRRLRLQLPGASTQLWSLSFRREASPNSARDVAQHALHNRSTRCTDLLCAVVHDQLALTSLDKVPGESFRAAAWLGPSTCGRAKLLLMSRVQTSMKCAQAGRC